MTCKQIPCYDKIAKIHKTLRYIVKFTRCHLLGNKYENVYFKSSLYTRHNCFLNYYYNCIIPIMLDELNPRDVENICDSFMKVGMSILLEC